MPNAQRTGRAYSGVFRRVTPCDGSAPAVQWSAPAVLLVPASHGVHAAAPASANVFAAHSAGAVLPSTHAYPAGHVTQLPRTSGYWPATHAGAWQDDAPASLTSLPGHAVQVLSPAAEYVLAGQVSQTLLVSRYWPSAQETGSTSHEDEPAWLLEPVGQGVQYVAPAAENVLEGHHSQTLFAAYWPARHVTASGVQDDEPAALLVSVSHAVQEDAPAAEKVSAGHSDGAAFPSTHSYPAGQEAQLPLRSTGY